VYSGNQRRLKYTFYLEPGADATQIEMTYDGIESLSVDDDTGELVIQTQWCPKMRDAKPVAYQEIDGVRREVSISFRLIDEKKVGFAVGNYDPKFRLTIDPGYSTYLGGSGSDYGYGIAVDSSGNAYVVGHTTNSTNFPTQSPFQGTYGGGNYDAFVTRLNISGSALEYSTYLGGSNWDEGFGIAVDSSGNAYVTGRTYSTNFPTQNPYQGTHGGGGLDAFVTKLNSAGSALSYSTYLGGSGDDGGFDIAVDSSGNAYVAGYTFSTNFPTQNPYQDSKGGDVDAFVTRLNISGSTLEYSTYLGGSSYDYGIGIAVDSLGNTYVTGKTYSTNFPTQSPYQDSNGGGFDAFVTRLNISGSALSYSTYLGGSDYDYGFGIAVDSSGNTYVAGYTTSTNFPTQSPYQGTFGGGYSDTFVTKLNISGSALEYSTYLGGNSDDGGSSIAVDSSGNAYVVGHTASTNFPTQSPYQGTFGGGSYDAFIASFFSDGSLPVELSLFTVTASEDGVTIRWRTETETNNLGFNIYRSDTKDGNYIKVNASLILGAGTDATPHDYSFIDENVVKGLTYYYYIEDVDFTGKTNISHILEVTVAEIARVREGAKPPKFALFQNFPNPFNPDTWIPYDVASDAVVIIRIYNTNGQLVRQMDLGKQKAGSYVDKKKAAYWDGKDQSGNAVASGVYFYTLKAGDFQATRRMVIVK
jgi:hypothetical protein